MMDLARARKVEIYLLDATSTWDATTNHKWTVPAGKRWFVIGGNVKRDANETLYVTCHNSSDEQILQLVSEAAATTLKAWPESDYAIWGGTPIVLDAGDYIYFLCGGAQGAAAYISGWVLEVDV